MRFRNRDAPERPKEMLAGEGFAITGEVDAADDATSGAEIECTRSGRSNSRKNIGGDFLGSGGFGRFVAD